ncbi:VOC family protein [Hirschia litorea]|uniref:VOC family protein n=1 Tax=Hirschia litorea TaxID=1199156 RepID=A0ABW2IJW6_9PROT
MNIYYVEFRAADFEPIKAFYSSAFGWEFEEWGEAYLAFSNAGIEGGFAKSTEKPPRGGPLVILLSEDTAQTEKIVEQAGGEIIERHEFPGGRRFHFLDPAGNELAVAMHLPLEQ